jgi:Fic family protein
MLSINQQLAIQFIKDSCGITGIKITDDVITKTLNRQEVNCHCAGHFVAFQYITTQLLNSQDFPSKYPTKIHHPYYAELSLEWILSLYHKLGKPLSQQGLIPYKELGCYRTGVKNERKEDKNAKKMAGAPPELIEKLMKNWIKELVEFNEKKKGMIINPAIITKLDSETLSKKAYDLHLSLICISPFYDMNGRVGRLVENLLRTYWNLPMRVIKPNSEEERIYKDDIARFYRNEFSKK